VDFAVVVQAACAVAAVVGIARDLIAECQHRNAAAFPDGAIPPFRSAPADQLVEFHAGDDSLVGRAPSFVVSLRNGRGIGSLGAADFDQDGAHMQIKASGPLPFKHRVNSKVNGVDYLHQSWRNTAERDEKIFDGTALK